MKSIHIRDVDPETLKQLKRLADLHHRSLQGELRAILDRAAKLAPVPPSRTIQLHMARSSGTGNWSREDIYDDSAR